MLVWRPVQGVHCLWLKVNRERSQLTCDPNVDQQCSEWMKTNDSWRMDCIPCSNQWLISMCMFTPPLHFMFCSFVFLCWDGLVTYSAGNGCNMNAASAHSHPPMWLSECVYWKKHQTQILTIPNFLSLIQSISPHQAGTWERQTKTTTKKTRTTILKADRMLPKAGEETDASKRGLTRKKRDGQWERLMRQSWEIENWVIKPVPERRLKIREEESGRSSCPFTLQLILEWMRLVLTRIDVGAQPSLSRINENQGQIRPDSLDTKFCSKS